MLILWQCRSHSQTRHSQWQQMELSLTMWICCVGGWPSVGPGGVHQGIPRGLVHSGGWKARRTRDDCVRAIETDVEEKFALRGTARMWPLQGEFAHLYGTRGFFARAGIGHCCVTCLTTEEGTGSLCVRWRDPQIV